MALYYYDGNKFQRCLNTDTVSGLTLDKRVEDLALFLEPGGNVNTLLSELKAMETCFYDIDEVPKLLYILTHRGWELVLTEDMNVRPKGLHTMEELTILMKEVPRANAVDRYNIKSSNFKAMSLEDGFGIAWPTDIKSSCTDIYNIPKMDYASQNNTENVIINIVPE